jgi:hypothetical protein
MNIGEYSCNNPILLNDKEFCFSLIGLSSTFLVVPQSEFTSREPQGFYSGFQRCPTREEISFQSANQIARFSEHSSLYLMLHVNKQGRQLARKN